MILFLHGPDSLLRLRRAGELLSAYLAKNPGADRLRVDLAEEPDNWKKAGDFLRQPSMFAEKKFLWVDSATEPEGAAWRKLLKEFLEDDKVFILLNENREPRKDFKFLTEAPAKAESFPELEGEALKKFILREAKKTDLELSSEALRLLIRKISGPHASWRAAALVGQLSAVSRADAATVAALLESDPQSVPLAAASFAGARPLSAARLEALERGILSGDPAYLFNSLVFRLRGGELLELSDLDANMKLGGLEYEEALLKIALG